LDACGVCQGPGAVYDCGCSDLNDAGCCGDDVPGCDNVCGSGAVVDECGDCAGDGSACACIPGDADGNGVVNVTDIVVMVPYILGGGTGGEGYECYDADGNGVVNVTDIVTNINYILGGGSLGSNTATEAIIEIASDQLSIRGVDGDVDGIQLILSHGSDFSIELVNVNQADMEFAAKRSINSTTTMVIVAKKDLSFIGTTTGGYDIISHVVVTTDEDGFTGRELSTSSTSITEIVDFKLAAAYPNPFNPTTTLELAIPEAGYISVKVYNLVGQEVATLIDGVMDANPSHRFQWNAGSLSSGVYLVRAEGAGQVTTQKLMLIK